MRGSDEVKTNSPAFWIAIVPLWIGVAFLAFEVERYHWNQPERMRGTSTYLPDYKTQEELADELVQTIEAIRKAGTEPERYVFDVPPGWKPPEGWTPPDAWNPPDWWP